MSLLDWGRLARVSLAPSAAADVAAGLAIGYAGFPSGATPWLAIASSLAVYHGGMVLNDYADREHDARTRPERPLPSGRIEPRAAQWVGIALVATALLLAALISWRAAAWMTGLATLVVSYDFFGRGAWLGPLLLGACRAANLGFGLLMSGALAADPLGVTPPNAALLMALYASYVCAVSRVARLEDVADDASIGTEPRYVLALAALLLCAPAFVAGNGSGFSAPVPWALALALAAAFGLARCVWNTRVWTRADAGRATGMALRRLLLFTAICVVAARIPGALGWIVAAAILAGFPVAVALRRAFPPT